MARRRAVQVCSACHERKVRCDLETSTKPCSKCRERHAECRPQTRKSYSTTNRQGKNKAITSEVNFSKTEQGTPSVSQIDHTKVFESIILQPSSRTTSIYLGESGYGTLMDTLGTKAPKRRHITVHGNTEAILNAEDLQYLKLKGCFEIPSESDDLLAAYFQFVHPMFPVIDGRSFLQDLADGGLEKVNLLLLWSMFSVSATYVPACRGTATKALFHMRGRLLFDLSGENDRLVFLQSALLLSFWFDDAEDIKQCWYWSGIAFDIALGSLGLHDKLKSSTEQSSDPKHDIWRNVWHCCMLRDAWLSYSMGRALRLDGARFISKSLLNTVSHFQDMELGGNRLYKDTEAEALEKMWQSSVIAAQTVRQSLLLKLGQQTGLSMWLDDRLQVQEDWESSVPLSMCGRHLRLCQNAATIAICQLSGAKDMAEPAADEIVRTANLYLLDTTIAFVPPMVVCLIMPAMLVSISALESDSPEKRKSGASRLSTCFDLLEAIEQSFPAASMVKRLFSAAYQTILTQPRHSPGIVPDTRQR